MRTCTGAPVAEQDAALDERDGHGAETAAVHRPGVRVVRRQPPAVFGAAGGALDDEHLLTAGVPGQHDLAGTDPAGAADQQPVTGPQGGLHRAFGDRDAQQRPVHPSLPASSVASGVVSGLQVNESEKGNR